MLEDLPWCSFVFPFRLWKVKVYTRLAQTSASLAHIDSLWSAFRLSSCACHTCPSLHNRYGGVHDVVDGGVMAETERPVLWVLLKSRSGRTDLPIASVCQRPSLSLLIQLQLRYLSLPVIYKKRHTDGLHNGISNESKASLV